jgi:hypothetical protein
MEDTFPGGKTRQARVHQMMRGLWRKQNRAKDIWPGTRKKRENPKFKRALVLLTHSR